MSTLTLFESLLAAFEAHARDHDKDEEYCMDVACSASSVDSGATQKQADCLVILSALPTVFQKVGADLCVIPRADPMYHQLSAKVVQFLGLLLDGRTCPHSAAVFEFGAPQKVCARVAACAPRLLQCYFHFRFFPFFVS